MQSKYDALTKEHSSFIGYVKSDSSMCFYQLRADLLAAALTNKNNLTHLDISNFSLLLMGYESFFNQLPQDKLEYLDISKNQLAQLDID